jgi:hypothetical protein
VQSLPPNNAHAAAAESEHLVDVALRELLMSRHVSVTFGLSTADIEISIRQALYYVCGRTEALGEVVPELGHRLAHRDSGHWPATVQVTDVLVLKKKAQEIWGDEDDDTDPENDE